MIWSALCVCGYFSIRVSGGWNSGVLWSDGEPLLTEAYRTAGILIGLVQLHLHIENLCVTVNMLS